VTVALLVFFTCTVTPGSGLLAASVTVPETVWADAANDKKKRNDNAMSGLLKTGIAASFIFFLINGKSFNVKMLAF
jgi:hypothetical protein